MELLPWSSGRPQFVTNRGSLRFRRASAVTASRSPTELPRGRPAPPCARGRPLRWSWGFGLKERGARTARAGRAWGSGGAVHGRGAQSAPQELTRAESIRWAVGPGVTQARVLRVRSQRQLTKDRAQEGSPHTTDESCPQEQRRSPHDLDCLVLDHVPWRLSRFEWSL